MVFNNESFGITKLYRDTNFKSQYRGIDMPELAYSRSQSRFPVLPRPRGLQLCVQRRTQDRYRPA